MATKSIKYLGESREYWINAAKQFIWPIDFETGQISVPESELQDAEDNLMVSHFRVRGWHIHSVMSVEHSKPFVAPIQSGPIFIPVKKEVLVESPLFQCGNRFRILSTGCELRISEIAKKEITLSYTDRDKPDIPTSAENLQKQLNRGLWVKL